MRNLLASNLEYLAAKVRKKEPMDVQTAVAVDSQLESTRDKFNEVLTAHGEPVITEVPKVDTAAVVNDVEDAAALPFVGGVEPSVIEVPKDTVHTDHLWKRGLLPGGKYIKTCAVGGEMVNIDFAEWSTISDR